MQERGSNLMSAIIEFFDSALHYFSHSFIGEFKGDKVKTN